MTQSQDLAVKISDLLAGEKIADVGGALAHLVAIYLTIALSAEGKQDNVESQRKITAQFMAAILREMRPQQATYGKDIMPKETMQ